MMMALSGTAAVPAYGPGCHGGSSCSGYTSCSGSYACSGYSCSGSHRGGFLSGLCHKRSSCSGYHGCTGYTGCTGVAACTGYVGCTGYANCSGCNGGHGLFKRHGNRGCHGSYGCSGYANCCGVVVVSNCCGCTGVVQGKPAAPAAKPAPAPAEKKPVEPKRAPAPASLNAAPAKVLVSLPADATLTIDGQATASQGASREFVSPALQVGTDYSYTIKVEVTRDGKPVSESKTVIVRAGETSEVSFGLATVAVN